MCTRTRKRLLKGTSVHIDFLGCYSVLSMGDECPAVSGMAHGRNFRRPKHIISYSSPHTRHLTPMYVHSSINATKDAAPSTATTLPTKFCTPEVALAVAALPVAVDEALAIEVLVRSKTNTPFSLTGTTKVPVPASTATECAVTLSVTI